MNKAVEKVGDSEQASRMLMEAADFLGATLAQADPRAWEALLTYKPAVKPPVVDISSEAVALATYDIRTRGVVYRSDKGIANLIEALAAEVDRLKSQLWASSHVNSIMAWNLGAEQRGTDAIAAERDRLVSENVRLAAELAAARHQLQVFLLALQEISHFGELLETAKEMGQTLDPDWPSRHARAAFAKLAAMTP